MKWQHLECGNKMKDLTKGNIYKTFLLFAIPLVLSGVLSQGYSIINTILAGKLLGDDALAVVGSLSPMDTFINAFFWGYGTGVGIYVGYLFGAGDFKKMKRMVISNFIFITSVLAVVCGLLMIFRYQVYAYLKVDPKILEEANRYFIISVTGKIFVMYMVNCVYVFHAIGDSKYTFYMSMLSSVLNITIAALAITQFGLGAEGLILGTVIAAAVISVCYTIRLGYYFKKLGVGNVKCKFSFQEIKETAQYSVFSMLQQSVMYFASFLLSPMVNGIGSAAAASLTVATRVYDINAGIYQNSTKTVGSYVAQCRGAKKYHLLQKGLFVGFIQSSLFVLPILLVTIFAAKPVAMIFYAADADPASIAYTVNFLKYCMPFLFCNIVANLFHHFLRGIGHMKALLITTVAGSVGRLLVSFILVPTMGLYGYYAAWVAAWVFDGATGLIIYLKGNWRKRLETEAA